MEIHNLLQIVTTIISFWLIIFGIGMITDTLKTKRLKDKENIKKEILRELKAELKNGIQ